VTALDLVDTLVTVTDPPTDLLVDRDSQRRWWAVQRPSLPDDSAPNQAATRQLRAAIRDLFDAHLEHRPTAASTLGDLNAAAASVPTSPRLVVEDDQPTMRTRWHTEHGGNANLAFLAREAMELIADPAGRQQLRRCANPACSMLFLATTTGAPGVQPTSAVTAPASPATTDAPSPRRIRAVGARRRDEIVPRRVAVPRFTNLPPTIASHQSTTP
jgi:predicted RNA-binding Zn ribbon-like protein